MTSAHVLYGQDRQATEDGPSDPMRQPPVTWATDALVGAVGPRRQPPCPCCVERPDGCRDDDMSSLCAVAPCRCRVAFNVHLCDGCIVELGL